MKRVRVSARVLAVLLAATVVVATWALTPAKEEVMATAAAQARAALPTPALHHAGLNSWDRIRS